jgi:hypothetical protein
MESCGPSHVILHLRRVGLHISSEMESCIKSLEILFSREVIGSVFVSFTEVGLPLWEWTAREFDEPSCAAAFSARCPTIPLYVIQLFRPTLPLKSPATPPLAPTSSTMATITSTETLTLKLKGSKNQPAPPRLPISMDHLPKLTAEQAGHLRHFHNLASQIDGLWNHMGAQEPGQVPTRCFLFC